MIIGYAKYLLCLKQDNDNKFVVERSDKFGGNVVTN